MNFNPSLKEVSKNKSGIAPGHRLCPGCGQGVILRQIFAAIKSPVVIANATGCMEICTSGFPYSSWNVPWIHSLFENTGAVISGVESMHRALAKRGKLTNKQKEIKFLAFGGDGGTYDIGLQALSGALERGHNFTYITFDNEGYMNTGGQRSSATPFSGVTTTSPSGEIVKGKEQFRKDITKIAAAHHIPYVAQAAPSNFTDLIRKVNKAVNTPGPAFIDVLSVCPLEWGSPTELGMEITQSAIDTCFWPLYEIESDKLKINYKPKKKKPIIEFFKNQKRFKHLMKKENSHLVDKFQNEVDRRWELLLLDEKSNK